MRHGAHRRARPPPPLRALFSRPFVEISMPKGGSCSRSHRFELTAAQLSCCRRPFSSRASAACSTLSWTCGRLRNVLESLCASATALKTGDRAAQAPPIHHPLAESRGCSRVLGGIAARTRSTCLAELAERRGSRARPGQTFTRLASACCSLRQAVCARSRRPANLRPARAVWIAGLGASAPSSRWPRGRLTPTSENPRRAVLHYSAMTPARPPSPAGAYNYRSALRALILTPRWKRAAKRGRLAHRLKSKATGVPGAQPARVARSASPRTAARLPAVYQAHSSPRPGLAAQRRGRPALLPVLASASHLFPRRTVEGSRRACAGRQPDRSRPFSTRRRRMVVRVDEQGRA